MEILSDNNALKEILSNSISRVLQKCDDEHSGQIKNYPLLIIDEVKADELFKDFEEYKSLKRAYEGGFGAAIMNKYSMNNRSYAVVVLNMSLIGKLELSNDEIDGVLSHELGHIFNEHTPRYLPPFSVSAEYFQAVKDINSENLKNKELYADYFSKITNNAEGLISSMEKYSKSTLYEKDDLFSLRLEILKSGTDKLIGIPRKINSGSNL